MKMRQVFSLLVLCLLGIFWIQTADATGAEAQVHLHKRLFVNQEVPSQINQSGELGNAELLKDSYGVNGSTFAIFEVSNYLQRLSTSLDQAKELIADEATVLRSELEVLATPSHPEKATIQARYLGIKFVQTKETAKGTFIDSNGNSVTEDGLLSVSLATGQKQIYLIVELNSGNQLPVDQVGLSSYLVLDSHLLTADATHVYTKNRGYVREPYFVKMAKEHDGSEKPLAGASFVLSKIENNEKFYLRSTAGSVSDWLSEKEVNESPLKDQRVKKMVSDQDGIVRTNLGLKCGNYQFEEVATVDGYEISDQARNISVEIPQDQRQLILINGIEVGALSEKEKLPVIYNQRVVGKKNFQKIDEHSGARLKNANFVVVNKGMRYLTKKRQWVTAEYGNDHLDELLILTSDEEGFFEISEMAYGSYSLLEVQAPDGYLLPENHFIDFEINAVSGETKEPLKIVNKKGENPELPSTDNPPNERVSYWLPSRRLPQTGMSHSIYLLVMGVICVLTVIIFSTNKKKKEY